MQTKLHGQYQKLLDQGAIRPDPGQRLMIDRLAELGEALENYAPKAQSGLRKSISKWRGTATATPRGLYMHGGVGRGKTMLMDLFFENVAVKKKRRVHFHAFMQDVQQRLHKHRQKEKGDPIPPLAEELIEEAWLLCFDEFVVTDIADAMILSRLFATLFDMGLVMVATSNVAPKNLYANGLHRERFVDFIGVLEGRVDIIDMQAEVDYRLERLRALKAYNTPLGKKADAILEEAFAALTGNAVGEEMHLRVRGHEFYVPRAAEGVAYFAFENLCAKPYGAVDYLALADHFHSIIISGIPEFTPDLRNEAKRFITLIDVAYENNLRLVCSAAVTPDKLYKAGDHAFEFERTSSRLFEMQSADYMAKTGDSVTKKDSLPEAATL